MNIIDVVPRSSLSPSSSLKGDVELNKKRATYYEDDDVVINVCIQNIILPQNVTWTLSKRMNMDEIKDYHDDFCNNYRGKTLHVYRWNVSVRVTRNATMYER